MSHTTMSSPVIRLVVVLLATLSLAGSGVLVAQHASGSHRAGVMCCAG